MSDSEELAEMSSEESNLDSISSDSDEDLEEAGEIDEIMEQALSSPQTPRVKTKCTPTALKFSNSRNVLCVGTTGGDLECFRCDDMQVKKLNIHECFVDSSCWSVDFSCDNKQAFCLSSTEGFASVNLETNSMNFTSFKEISELYCLKTIDERTICVGDYSGHIHLWDIRQFRPDQCFKPILTLNDNTGDYVSCMLTNSHHLAAGSGSGVVTIFDLRSSKLLSQNFDSKADVLSITQLDNKPIIAVASLSSEITIFSWYDNQNSHRYEILPSCVCNEIRAVNESTVLTAWDDGTIRLNSLFPHQPIGTVGRQNPPGEFADLNHDKTIAASIGIDKVIRLWNLENVECSDNQSYFNNI